MTLRLAWIVTYAALAIGTAPISGHADDLLLHRNPEMHTGAIFGSAVDAAQRFVVTVGSDRMVRVWSLEDGGVLQRWPGIGGPDTVAISPNGSQVAFGGIGTGNSFAIHVHDVESGDLRHRVNGLPDWARHLVYSQDGRYLAVTLRGANGLRIYETSGYGEVARDDTYDRDSFGATFDSSGRLATTSHDGRIRLYDTGFSLIQEIEVQAGEGPRAISFSPDDSWLAVGYHNVARVDVLQAGTLRLRSEVSHDDVGLIDISRVAWSPDGEYLWAGAWTADETGSRVIRWSTSDLASPVGFDVSGGDMMVVHPLSDGRAVIVSEEIGDPYVALIDADGATIWERRRPTADFEVTTMDRPIRVSADGTVVQFNHEPEGRRPAQFDVLTGALEAADQSRDDLAPPRMTVPGFAIGDWWNGVMPSVDGRPFDLRRTDDPLSWAVAPDEQAFAFGTRHRLYLFDREGGRLWWVGVPGDVWSVTVSGDGRLVVAALGDGTIRWYDRETGAERLALFPHADGERWVAWTPEGFYTASAGKRRCSSPAGRCAMFCCVLTWSPRRSMRTAR